GRVEMDGVRQFKSLAERNVGLVPVRDVGLDRGRLCYYYTMPLADDVKGNATIRDPGDYEPMTLRKCWEMHRPLPTDRVLAIALHVLPSLHALHEAGFVHRDVKPGNIVMVEGTWRLCDVGLLDRRDRIRCNSGTPGFLPPEGAIDRRADVYAIG